MKKLMKKLIAMAAALVMIVTLLPAVGVNAEAFGSRDKGTITIIKNGDTENEFLAGAEFSFYRLASISKDSITNVWEYTVENDFKSKLGNGGNLNDLPSQTWESQIDDLAALAQTPTYTSQLTAEVTGSTGPTEVTVGIYLVKETTTPSGYIASKPFIVSVPSTDNYSNNKPGSAAIAGDDWTYDITAEPKNEKQTIEKSVDDLDKTVGIGETKNYTLKTSIPTYGTEYDTETIDPVFNIYDRMSSGLEFQDDIKVTVDGKPVVEAQDTYTIFTDDIGDKTFEIRFAPDFIMKNTGKEVVVTYSAEITKDAVYEIGNTAGIKYNNRPGETQDVTGDKVKVYTFGIDLTKKDATSGNGLNNAEFTLSDGTDEVIKFVVNNGNVVVDESETLSTVTIGEENGKLIIKGLPAGTYTLTETKSPAGYTLLTQPITIVINAKEDGTFDSATIDGTSVKSGVVKGMVPVEVKNSKGFTLPSTGGMGTYLFTIGGIVIMAGAAFALIAMKKRA